MRREIHLVVGILASALAACGTMDSVDSLDPPRATAAFDPKGTQESNTKIDRRRVLEDGNELAVQSSESGAAALDKCISECVECTCFTERGRQHAICKNSPGIRSFCGRFCTMHPDYECDLSTFPPHKQ